MADSDWDPRKAARAACLAHGDVADCYVSFWHLADVSLALTNVHFWGKADMPDPRADVRQ